MKLRILFLLFVMTNALAQTGTIKGRVFDGSNLPFQKAPLVGANVQLWATHLGATTDTVGYFSIRGLPLGLCSLRVTAVGFEPEIIRVVVEEDSAKQEVTETILLPECVSHGIPQVYRVSVPDSLRESTISKPKKPLPGKCSVSGRVTDKNTGKPVSSAQISVNFDFWSEEGHRTGCCLGGPVDSTGRYALNHKDPGRYNIRACAEGYGRSARLIETKADSTYVVDFDLVKDTTKK